MAKKILMAVAGSAMLLPALAVGQVRVINGEAGIIFVDPPSAVARDQVKAAASDPTAHWTYVGGEAIWRHNDSKYVFDAGTLVHASDCPALATLNKPMSRGDVSTPLPGYTGA